MKKLLFIIPLILINCTKKETDSKMITADSTEVFQNDYVENPKDSSSKGVVFPTDAEFDKKEMAQTFRAIEGDKIIKTINGDMLPINFEDELTADHVQMIIKIKNFKGDKISGTLTSLKPGMNIRFNQIRMADGEYDGPFGGEINYDIKDKGEIWLIIGKNLMASTETTGKFKVSLN